MEKGRIEFDDPGFRESKGHRVDGAAANVSMAKALRAVCDALANAPHKHRIDFQPYWDWYEGARVAAIDLAQEALKGYMTK